MLLFPEEGGVRGPPAGGLVALQSDGSPINLDAGGESSDLKLLRAEHDAPPSSSAGRLLPSRVRGRVPVLPPASDPRPPEKRSSYGNRLGPRHVVPVYVRAAAAGNRPLNSVAAAVRRLIVADERLSRACVRVDDVQDRNREGAFEAVPIEGLAGSAPLQAPPGGLVLVPDIFFVGGPTGVAVRAPGADRLRQGDVPPLRQGDVPAGAYGDGLCLGLGLVGLRCLGVLLPASESPP
ncbi:hypothetical protein THAOC_37340, partial [Thalassiosira oceanica]